MQIQLSADGENWKDLTQYVRGMTLTKETTLGVEVVTYTRMKSNEILLISRVDKEYQAVKVVGTAEG